MPIELIARGSSRRRRNRAPRSGAPRARVGGPHQRCEQPSMSPCELFVMGHWPLRGPLSGASELSVVMPRWRSPTAKGPTASSSRGEEDSRTPRREGYSPLQAHRRVARAVPSTAAAPERVARLASRHARMSEHPLNAGSAASVNFGMSERSRRSSATLMRTNTNGDHQEMTAVCVSY